MITDEGELWVCGSNYSGQLASGLGEADHSDRLAKVELPATAKQVAAGSPVTVLITEGGQLWSCGSKLYGQLRSRDKVKRSLFIRIKLAAGTNS